MRARGPPSAVVFVALAVLTVGGTLGLHADLEGVELAHLGDVEPLDVTEALGDLPHLDALEKEGKLSLLQTENEAADVQELHEISHDPSPLDKLSSELKNLHTIRKEANQMLHSASKAVTTLNSAVTDKSAEGATIIAGANGGKALARVAKAMDKSADKCKDFYQYSCGAWRNNTKKPADAAVWAKTFSVITRRNMKFQRKLFSKNTTIEFDTVSSDDVEKVKSYYAACMDSKGRDKRGLKDGNFTSLRDQIVAVKNVTQLMALYGTFGSHGLHLGPFSMGVGLDEMDSSKNVAGVSQAGLGLPAKEYYGVVEGKDNERFKKLRMAYVKFMDAVFKMAEVKADPEKVLAFETKIAKVMWDKVKMRDPKLSYFGTTIGNFTKNHLSFLHYFRSLRQKFPAFDKDVKFVVSPIQYFKQLETILAAEHIETLKGYTLRQFLSSIMPATTTSAGDLNFEFYGKILRGTQQRPALWKRCVASTLGATWGIADRMFVEKKFNAKSKKLANEMIDFLVQAFASELDKSEWMDEATVAGAKAKLHAMNRKIGYPSVWRQYIGLTTGRNFLENMLSSKKVETAREFDKLGKEVDKTEWAMNPSMTNAYYSPNRNEMVFPAGILQPPFFGRRRPAVLNFGAIGAVIGHELTHGFDDQGAQFDAKGNMKMWWSKKSFLAFKNRTSCMIKQYQGIPVRTIQKLAPNLKINGKLTLGENIADNGGLKAAFSAYTAWQKKKDTPTEYRVNGKTVPSNQLFFISYGQSWCSIAAPKSVMVQIRSDPHSPSEARVVGPIQNSRDFATAFPECKVGTPMNPAAKCTVW